MKTLFVSAALLALASAASAGEVPNGSQWSGGGGDETITVNVTDDPATSGGSAFYSTTDSSGTSAVVPGDMGQNGTDLHPTVKNGDETSTPGGQKYRAHNGKMQRKGRDGTWKDMKQKRKKGCKDSRGFERIHAGDPAPHAGRLYASGRQTIPLLEAELAPWDGFLLGPGEEVTSLPE